MSGKATTARGRATRQRIIEATGERILQAGIGGTSLENVQSATLTSKSQLFHYFPGGKTELIQAVAEWEGTELLAAQEPELHDLSTRESWARWKNGLLDYYVARGRWACPIGSLVNQLSLVDETTADLVAQALSQWAQLIADGVRRLQENSDEADHLDPDTFAASVLAAVQGGLILSQSARSSAPLEAALHYALAPITPQSVR